MRAPRLTLPALAALVALAAGACSGNGQESEADIKANLVAQIQEDQAGLDKATAGCIADVVIDEVGVKELRDVDFSAEEPPAELQDAFASAAVKAYASCELDASSLGG